LITKLWTIELPVPPPEMHPILCGYAHA